MKGLGKRLKRIREQKGMTQKDVSDKLGKSYQYISNIENDRATISLDRLEELVDILGCEVRVSIKC